MIGCRASASAEPLAGTAPQASTWWLVEVPGAWGKQAVAECRVPGVAALRSDADRRVLLVRRPGRHPAQPRQEVVRVWSAPGSGGTLRQLLVPVDQLADADANRDSLRWDVEPDSSAPRLLICTNAARDACCGLEGRALLRDLVGVAGVWECSHLGGHRFAATALQVRQGMVYGRLTPEAARDIAASDQVDPRWAAFLRGCPALSPELQATQVEVLRSVGRMPSMVGALSDGSIEYRVGDTLGRASADREALGEWPVSCGGAAEQAHAWRVSLSPR